MVGSEQCVWPRGGIVRVRCSETTEAGGYFRWEGIGGGFLEAVLLAEAGGIRGRDNKKGGDGLAGGKSTGDGWEARNNGKEWDDVYSSSSLGRVRT